ncbi:UDP-glucose/GDP-mannose dehydrogenase family protein [Frigoribacterium sp. NBH87]|uniref:UDP-glucose dehydrogenase family protein n=1 Tax=Frigoribacterium sp. NBH87 TaxID=2596916 RepID=UPI001627F733|nr:UDP-glucose/GDP-mannose dehydrogenase family protein [Frigoribacterium sp. NBH87]QNE44787.1 UDP-glucose/GDP-mannose dehydrogenase family protein [Frigoribacterium sp. NBH87]
MRISVVGCGYLGAVHAACMAELGHDVVGIDVDEHKVAELSAGRPPFFEPGLPEVLARGVASGRLRFTSDMAEAAGARVHFVAVGTPQTAGSHAADLRYVDAAVTGLLPHLGDGDLVVGKSTVPVGTAARLADLVRDSSPADLAWNPEFLREGFAVADTLSPDRFVYGVRPGPEGDRATGLLDEVYATPLTSGMPRIVTDYATAELVKVSANAFLATKISFINAMAEIAEATGADVTQLADAIGHDARIGRRFLNAGLGFGGGCLPKDIRAFQARADELGLDSLAFLADVDAVNLRRRQRVVDLAGELVGTVEGAQVAVLGVAFKPDSDDVRDSPALDVARSLHEQGALVTVFDPEATETARRVAPELRYAADVDEALTGADVVLVLTEWAQFRALDPASVAGLVRGRRIVDGRNVLDASTWRAAGFEFRGLGRP